MNANKKIRVILTGATGMVGEGVLHECLQSNEVEQVLLITRKPYGLIHEKLREIMHPDFFDITNIESSLAGYDACFFCSGVSVIGKTEDEYFRLTYTLTIGLATALARLNRNMVFCYVSGAGTDSSEKGRSMWARIKGKTENELLKLPFKGVYLFRPGYMHPTPGLKNTLKSYAYLSWLYPILRLVFPRVVSTLKELGLAMIHVATQGYPKKIIEVTDIHTMTRSEKENVKS